MISFEDYLCNRNDAIDNAAYQLICAMTAQDHNEPKEDDPAVPDWNMEIIGELVDAAEEIIQEKAGHTCHPFYCDSTWREDPFSVPEEELAMWAIISPNNMLIQPAQERYMDLFTRVFGITREQLTNGPLPDVKLEVQ